jgi:hypothetical protein
MIAGILPLPANNTIILLPSAGLVPAIYGALPLKHLIVLAACLLALSGCTHRYIDFTAISSKNIDLSRGAEFVRGDARVTGTDKAHIIIFIPTGQPNAKEALDRAIESTPGAVALVDGVVSNSFWWIPYIYGQSSVVVEGTPLIDPRLLPGYKPTAMAPVGHSQ